MSKHIPTVVMVITGGLSLLFLLHVLSLAFLNTPLFPDVSSSNAFIRVMVGTVSSAIFLSLCAVKAHK